MKRIIPILLVLSILISCKDQPQPQPDSAATVKYIWSTASKATYDIEYTGVNGTPIDTTYTGTSFVKTIKVTRASGFKIATLKVFCHPLDPNNFRIEGGMAIYRNASFDAANEIYSDSDFTKAFTCSTSVFGN